MASLTQVILFSLAGSLFSLVGGLLLLADKRRAKLMAEYATPFAAGALLAAAFLDLLKEGAERGDATLVLQWALGGLLLFFILESALNWFHHHHEHQQDSKNNGVDRSVSLVIIGDVIHNFIDGAAIAAAFLVSAPTGIVTTLAVAAHEIPQEIGDFGLMLNKGLKRRQTILVNLMSALATVVAAIIFFTWAKGNEQLIQGLLGLTAGFFIYIAVSDVIPGIHSSRTRRSLNIKSLLLILGVLVVGVTTTIMHSYIDQGHQDSGPAHSPAREDGAR